MADHPSLEDLGVTVPRNCPRCQRPVARVFVNLPEPERQLAIALCWECRWLYSVEERKL